MFNICLFFFSLMCTMPDGTAGGARLVILPGQKTESNKHLFLSAEKVHL